MTYHRPPSDDDAERAVDELQERRARRAAADERRARAAVRPHGHVQVSPSTTSSGQPGVQIDVPWPDPKDAA